MNIFSLLGMRWHAVIFTLVLTILPFNLSASAQADFVVTDSKADHQFGESITFQAHVETSHDIADIILFFRPEGNYKTYNHEVTIDSSGNIRHIQNVSAQPIPPFSKVHFWYQLTTADGQVFTSSSSSFDYVDNRFSWHEKGSQLFRVHWYNGDSVSAQNVLDTAAAGMDRINGLLFSQAENLASASPLNSGVGTPQGDLPLIDIYIYENTADLQSALELGGPNWVAGHADPELRVVLVSLPNGPERILEIERQIPHELAHIALYQKSGPGYYSLPVWLNEGIASINETSPNPDYLLLLNRGYESETLLPMGNLCNRFPVTASEALLAYAQATSFTRTLQRQYGNSGIQELINQYADGKSCETGAQDALGKPLSELERDWRRSTFAENAWTVALGKLLPWLSLLALIVGPLLAVAVFHRRGPQG